jgi:hypothetical protein
MFKKLAKVFAAKVRRSRRLRVIRGDIEKSCASAGSVNNPLTASIVVSLTSFPARFSYLHLVIQSLQVQTLRPDKIVLYLDQGHKALLPDRITKLQSAHFEIRERPPVRSYAKLVYALEDFSDENIVTVDDDVIYRAELLETLADGARDTPGVIMAHRAHRISTSIDGILLPYTSWSQDVQDNFARTPSVDLLATGVGGVLYPPGSMHPDALDVTLARKICPEADDIWFYWMARRAGTRYCKVGGATRMLMTPGSQRIGLRHGNVEGAGNDVQIAAMWRRFGPPAGLGAKLPIVDATEGCPDIERWGTIGPNAPAIDQVRAG